MRLFKLCTCCDRQYTLKGWKALTYVGVQKSEDETHDYELELRNCVCGTTLGVEKRVKKGKS